MSKLTDIVKASTFSHFKGFSDSQFWYSTSEGYLFPIPAADIVGVSALRPHEKTIGLMKWIKAHIENTVSA